MRSLNIGKIILIKLEMKNAPLCAVRHGVQYLSSKMGNNIYALSQFSSLCHIFWVGVHFHWYFSLFYVVVCWFFVCRSHRFGGIKRKKKIIKKKAIGKTCSTRVSIHLLLFSFGFMFKSPFESKRIQYVWWGLLLFCMSLHTANINLGHKIHHYFNAYYNVIRGT